MKKNNSISTIQNTKTQWLTMTVTDIDAYHKIITDSYDQRSMTYDDSDWHSTRSRQLVDYEKPPINGVVLDIATGTGTIARHVATMIGKKGKVAGIDISEGMITKAQELSKDLASNNIDFHVADAEKLTFPHDHFDRIYCGHAFFWMSDKFAALDHWRNLLKPEGIVGFHAWPKTTYITAYIAGEVLKKYGAEYVGHSQTGTKDKCVKLLENAGYEHIQIIEKEEGHYITLEDAKDSWITECHYPIGQYPHPVSDVSIDILAQARADYEAEMEKLHTEKGIWVDTTMYYVYGQKPKNI